MRVGGKMKYFKLLYDYEKDNDYVNCDHAHLGSIDKYVLNRGEIIKQWENIMFEYNSVEGNILTDYIANLYRWLIVSDRFIQLTNDILCNQVQYLPITIRDKQTNKEIDSYRAVNILNVADGLDLEKAIYDYFSLNDQKIISVRKYVLKGNSIKGQHIFRLKDDMIPIFVSENFKKIIEDNMLVGFDFFEVEVV